MPSASNKPKGRHSSHTNKGESPPLSPDKDAMGGGGVTSSNPSHASLDLYKHRWVVGAGDSIQINISFVSKDLGQFDQTLNFELVGTRRRYQLFCRGMNVLFQVIFTCFILFFGVSLHH